MPTIVEEDLVTTRGTIAQLPTYLAAIQGSLGSTMCRNLFVRTACGGMNDITQDGLLSCAYFVSWIQYHFKLIQEPHATIDGLLRDMDKSGWRVTRLHLHPGAILVWEPQAQAGSDELHRHVGFFMLDHNEAISHSDKERVPVRHHWTFGGTRARPTRKVQAIYTHPFLEGLF